MGGFFKNPWKATKGFVNKVVPGGKYLTGRAAEHQKYHYNLALDKYNNYASEAQNQINNLSQNLQQSMHNLRSLEEQKYHNNMQGQQLQSHASSYQQNLSRLEHEKTLAANEAGTLKAAFEGFKNKAPALASKISEVEKLPAIFSNLYETIAQQKQSLAGLTGEEAATHINKHKADVENLKKQREETESKIRASMEEITGQHKGLEREKSNLEQSLEKYKYRQDRLLYETGNFESERNQLTSLIQDYKSNQDRISNEYSKHQSQVNNRQKSLQDYINNAQTQLDALGGDVDWRAGKYERESRTTGLVRGAALGLATFGVGMGLSSLSMNTLLPWTTSGQIAGAIGTGLQYASPLLGIGHYLHTGSKGQSLRGLDRVNLGEGYNSSVDLSHIARLGLGGSKVSIPELGGLKQSLSHFEMPTVPTLRDLPKLHEALGKITSLKDIESLGLGLPGMTSASGKKYSSEVLYNTDFLKKLKKVSRRLGSPPLRNSINHNYNHSQGAATYA